MLLSTFFSLLSHPPLFLSSSFSFSSNPISRTKKSTAFTPQNACIKCIVLLLSWKNTCICPPLLTFHFRSFFIAHFSCIVLPFFLHSDPTSTPLMEPYIPSFFSIKVGGVKVKYNQYTSLSLLLILLPLFLIPCTKLFLISFQFFGDPLGVNCLDHVLVDEESLRLEEEEHLLISSLEDNMPFLQMLQSVESPQFFPLKETNFQTLLRLQHKKNPWEGIAYFPRMEAQQVQAALELESCVTHDMSEMQYSPVKSESNELQHPLSVSCFEKKVNYECNQEPQKVSQTCPKSQPAATRERRKRKRTRPSKNKEDVENQRMTHIAVERNRRRQMNDHLSVLRSLMPPSYIQRVCALYAIIFF